METNENEGAASASSDSPTLVPSVPASASNDVAARQDELGNREQPADWESGDLPGLDTPDNLGEAWEQQESISRSLETATTQPQEPPANTPSIARPTITDVSNKEKRSGLSHSKYATDQYKPKPPYEGYPESLHCFDPVPVQVRGRGRVKYNGTNGRIKIGDRREDEDLPDNKKKADALLAAAGGMRGSQKSNQRTIDHPIVEVPPASRGGLRRTRGRRRENAPLSQPPLLATPSHGAETKRTGGQGPSPSLVKRGWKGGCGSVNIPDNNPYQATIRPSPQKEIPMQFGATNSNDVEDNLSMSAPVQKKLFVDDHVAKPESPWAGTGKIGYCVCGSMFFLGKAHEALVKDHLERCADSNGCLSPNNPAQVGRNGKTAQKAMDKLASTNAKPTRKASSAALASQKGNVTLKNKESSATLGGRKGIKGRSGMRRDNTKHREGAPSPSDISDADDEKPTKGRHQQKSQPAASAQETEISRIDNLTLSREQLQGIIGAAVTSALESTKSQPPPGIGLPTFNSFPAAPGQGHIPGAVPFNPAAAYSYSHAPPVQPQWNTQHVAQVATTPHTMRGMVPPRSGFGVPSPPPANNFNFSNVPKGPKAHFTPPPLPNSTPPNSQYPQTPGLKPLPNPSWPTTFTNNPSNVLNPNASAFTPAPSPPHTSSPPNAKADAFGVKPNKPIAPKVMSLQDLAAKVEADRAKRAATAKVNSWREKGEADLVSQFAKANLDEVRARHEEAVGKLNEASPGKEAASKEEASHNTPRPLVAPRPNQSDGPSAATAELLGGASRHKYAFTRNNNTERKVETRKAIAETTDGAAEVVDVEDLN